MKCRVIEAKLDLLKNLIQIWSVFILASASGLGFLIYRSPSEVLLILPLVLLLGVFITTWIFMIIYTWSLSDKLETCKED